MTTGFFWDERCFWHGGGNYALTAPVGGLVQPLATGGLPETPEAKRRLKSLMEVTVLWAELDARSAEPASRSDLERVHPTEFLDNFRALSDAGGGELGLRAPFGPGGYEIATVSAGLALAAVREVAQGQLASAYALTRPPGHHCLPDWQNGFCLLANIAIAVEAARAEGLIQRVAILDWDVHHGNGTIRWAPVRQRTGGGERVRARTSTYRCPPEPDTKGISLRWTELPCRQSDRSAPNSSWWQVAMTPPPSIPWDA